MLVGTSGHTAGMAITSIQTSAGTSAIVSARTEAVAGGSSFAGTLATQKQQEAARAVLTALPAPIVYSLRDHAGSPADAVDRLFGVLKDGSFSPPVGALGRPESIIGATAHATTLFDTPAQLWDAMRAAIAEHSSGGLVAAPSGARPSAVAAGPPPVEVRTLEDAERLLGELHAGPAPATSIAGVPMSAGDAAWWDAALLFLLGARATG